MTPTLELSTPRKETGWIYRETSLVPISSLTIPAVSRAVAVAASATYMAAQSSAHGTVFWLNSVWLWGWTAPIGKPEATALAQTPGPFLMGKCTESRFPRRTCELSAGNREWL